MTYFDINWSKFEIRWADVFQIYPNAIHFNPIQFCPSMSLFGFPVFCLTSSVILGRYFDILANSMTIGSVLKLPKIAWRSPFKTAYKRGITGTPGTPPQARSPSPFFPHAKCGKTSGSEQWLVVSLLIRWQGGASFFKWIERLAHR